MLLSVLLLILAAVLVVAGLALIYPPLALIGAGAVVGYYALTREADE